MKALRTLTAVVTMLASAIVADAQERTCPDPLKLMLRTELYFGRNIGGRLGVSERQWARFRDSELTAHLPDGFTVIDAKGQWRDGPTIVREPSKLVIVLTGDDADARARIAAATQAYIKRFRQKSVGVVTQPVCAAF
jgi:hypothetical protein